MLNFLIKLSFLFAILLIQNYSLAATFEIPDDSNIIGALQNKIIQPNDTLFDIANDFDIGLFEILEANPSIDPDKVKVGTKIIIPSEYILPSGERNGRDFWLSGFNW